MADFNIQPIGAQIKPMQGMSLADMINTARGFQAYQQAEQVNPLTLQQQQQATRTGELALGVEEQKNKERLNMMRVMTDPSKYTTDNKFDPDKARQIALEVAPMTGLSYMKDMAGAFEAQEKYKTSAIGTQQADLKLALDRVDAIARRVTSLYNNDMVIKAEKDPAFAQANKGALVQLMHQYGKEQADALGLPADKARDLISPYIHEALDNPSGVRKFLEGKQLSAIDAANRLLAVQPKPSTVEYASGSVQVDTNPLSPTFGGKIPGTETVKGLAPFTGTTETGAPGVFKGTPGGIVNPPGQAPSATPQQPPTVTPGAAPRATEPTAKPTQPTIGGGSGALNIAPGETYDAYKERVARVGKLPAMANNAMNLGNPESVPNMEYTNDKILKLLEKKVDVGAIANAIANKTGGIGLSSDQQEIQKYLEQRIRQQATRTDQDQSSIRSAFGSFGTNREALLDIIYNDKGTLASQKMYYQGIKKYQGNATKPNLAAVSEFENKFNEINQDPDVAHLLGVIGTKKSNQLSKTDVQHLQKYFGNMPDDRIQDLFKKRDELIRLVEGGK